MKLQLLECKKNDFFNSKTLQHHITVMNEIIRRDKNHPSVVMWSVANEPASNVVQCVNYFQQVANATRHFDTASRPVTFVTDQQPDTDLAMRFFDVICVNRYFGWYTTRGAVNLIENQLENNLRAWNTKFNKPVIVSEYGADTIPGYHSDPPLMFTEEFQQQFMGLYQKVFDKLKSEFVIGELVWNFADFETAQGTIRIGGKNHKGVFTRQRNPKPAAFDLKARYKNL